MSWYADDKPNDPASEALWLRDRIARLQNLLDRIADPPAEQVLSRMIEEAKERLQYLEGRSSGI